jgi:hypothetical protein
MLPALLLFPLLAFHTANAEPAECLDPAEIHATSNVNNDAPFRAAICDIDNDGDDDIVTANDASNSVSFLLNDGSGDFSSFHRLAVGASDVVHEPVAVACCDFNGDEVSDLVTANHTTDEVSLLIGNGVVEGVPTFVAPIHFSVGEAPWAVYCGTVDTDLHVDIVTANFTTNDVSVLINDTAGGIDLDRSYSVPVGGGPRALDACNVDGDDDLDFVVVNMLGESVTVIRNDGGAGLLATGTFPIGENPFGITCCDLDGQNGPDVVTAQIIADSIAVLLNDGSGALGDPTIVSGADGATALACADFDHDGDRDLATANLSGDTVTVFENTGGGTLASAVPIFAGDNPTSVSSLQLQPSTEADLALTFANGVAVMANICAPSAQADLNDDGQTDLRDVALFQVCFAVSPLEPDCTVADIDSNGAVDLHDYALLGGAITSR